MKKLFLITISSLFIAGCSSTGVYGKKSGSIKQVKPMKVEKVDSHYGVARPNVEKAKVILPDKDTNVSIVNIAPIKPPSATATKYSNTGADALKAAKIISPPKGDVKESQDDPQSDFWPRVLMYYLYLTGLLVAGAASYYGYKIYKTHKINPFLEDKPAKITGDPKIEVTKDI